MTTNTPSLDPADNDTLAGAFNLVLKKMMQNFHVALPAKVVSAQRTPIPRVQVQPLINVLTTGNNQIPRQIIGSIPIVQIGGGGVLISFNVKPGDQGLLIACDRDISNYLQSNTQAQANTFRTHDFADSFFIPYVIASYVINEEDVENAVMQTTDGSLRLAFDGDRIKITGDLFVDGDIKATGSIMPNVPPEL